MKHKIIWLSGPSGAGKTTVAKAIARQVDCTILDGDEMRKSISLEEGFSKEDRKRHNYKVARIADVLSIQRPVIVSVIAPQKEVRMVIDMLINPVWVYVKRELPEREGHFYEESFVGQSHTSVDHDKLNPEESADFIIDFAGLKRKE